VHYEFQSSSWFGWLVGVKFYPKQAIYSSTWVYSARIAKIEEGEGMKNRIGLVTVLTSNIQSLKSFYSEVLGFTILTDLGDYVEFSNEGVRFAICKKEIMEKTTNHPSYQEQSKGQSFELAFPVGSPEDVDRTYSEIVAKGAIPIKAPEMMPWGRKTAFFADPDGNIHEIYSCKPEDFEN
jgi:lactoylglutathione lyase